MLKALWIPGANLIAWVEASYIIFSFVIPTARKLQVPGSQGRLWLRLSTQVLFLHTEKNWVARRPLKMHQVNVGAVMNQEDRFEWNIQTERHVLDDLCPASPLKKSTNSLCDQK